jgi:hypothetical protein
MLSSKGAHLDAKRKRGRPLTVPKDRRMCPVMSKLVGHVLVGFERDCEPRGCKYEQFLECLWWHDIIEEG